MKNLGIFEQITKIVGLHTNGMSEDNVVIIAKKYCSKLQMSRISALTGISRDLFWSVEKRQPLPADYWNFINDAIANPEQFENNLVVTPDFVGNYK